MTTTEAPLWGAWSVKHYTAKKRHDCSECGYMILRNHTYWRRYGKMAESNKPWTSRLCERCEEKWRQGK